MGSPTGAGEAAPNEKGFVVSCSTHLAGVWSKENTLPSSIPPKEGLGASIADKRVLAKSGVPSSLTKATLGSSLEGFCDPKVKGRGDVEDCGGMSPKAAVVFSGSPSSICASPSRLSGMEDGTFTPDEDLDVAWSKLAGFLETGNKKDWFGSTAVVDPKFGASSFASVGLLKEKGSIVVGVTSAKVDAKAEPDGVLVAVFSSARSIFCADLSSARWDSLSPSQKGFSESLTG